MSTESREVVRRFFEAWSRQDLDTAANLVTEDFVDHSSSSQGRAGIIEEGEFWFSAFPDAAVSIEDLISEGDKVVVRLSSTATHRGDFFGAAPTGRTIEVHEIDIARVENGLIAEMWAAPDIYGMLAQLGLLPDELVPTAV